MNGNIEHEQNNNPEPKSPLEKWGGFNPVCDVMIPEVGLLAASVYGRVWRFCQMEYGVCTASLNTIAKYVGVDASTACRRIKLLCEKGYLRDLTPDSAEGPHHIRKPHIYQDTGEAIIEGLVAARTVARKESAALKKLEAIHLADGSIAHSNSPIAQSNSLLPTAIALLPTATQDSSYESLEEIEDEEEISPKICSAGTSERTEVIVHSEKSPSGIDRGSAAERLSTDTMPVLAPSSAAELYRGMGVLGYEEAGRLDPDAKWADWLRAHEGSEGYMLTELRKNHTPPIEAKNRVAVPQQMTQYPEEEGWENG